MVHKFVTKKVVVADSNSLRLRREALKLKSSFEMRILTKPGIEKEYFALKKLLEYSSGSK
jgi:hypothetical protein